MQDMKSKKIKSYTIVGGNKIDKDLIKSHRSLIDKVQSYIDNGWQPWGDPFILGDGSSLYQAMVIYDE